MNYYQKIWASSYSKWIFGTIAALFVLYQCTPNPRMDDDILGEQAYWASKLGFVKSELLRGFGGLGYEHFQGVFHKLFIYQGAASVRVFGWSVYALHLVNYVYFLLFVGLLYKYVRRYLAADYSLFLGALALLMLNYQVAYCTGSYRPEVTVMTFGFASFYCLRSNIERATKSHLLAAAILAAMAAFSHLNGLMYIVAGFALLLLRQHYGRAIIFGTVASFVFLGAYFADVLAYSSIENFLFQFRHEPSLGGSNFAWYSPLLKIINEQARFLYNEREVPYTLAIVAALGFGFRFLKEKIPIELAYSFMLVLFMAGMNYSKSPQYLVCYAPFLVLILVLGWQRIEAQGKPLARYTLRSFLVFSFGINVFFMIKGIGGNISFWQKDSKATTYAKLAALIPQPHDTINILAHHEFVFDQLPQFQRIQGINKYTWFAPFYSGIKPTFSQIIDSAATYNIHYIVIPKPELLDRIDSPMQMYLANARNYSLIDSVAEHYLIKMK